LRHCELERTRPYILSIQVSSSRSSHDDPRVCRARTYDPSRDSTSMGSSSARSRSERTTRPAAVSTALGRPCSPGRAHRAPDGAGRSAIERLGDLTRAQALRARRHQTARGRRSRGEPTKTRPATRRSCGRHVFVRSGARPAQGSARHRRPLPRARPRHHWRQLASGQCRQRVCAVGAPT
jgi:hypothetical protein